MKKTILLITLLCGFSLLCYANGSLELFGGVPLTWEDGELLGTDADMQMTSISAGFGLISPINDKAAFGVWDEIIFPQTMKMTIAGEEATVERSDYDMLMGMSVTLAPIFYLYSGDKLKIPLHVGIKGMWLAASQTYSNIFEVIFGFEAGIGAEFHITERFKLFGRVKGMYDFFTINTITVSGYYSPVTTTTTGFINSFGLTPHIGLGISF